MYLKDVCHQWRTLWVVGLLIGCFSMPLFVQAQEEGPLAPNVPEDVLERQEAARLEFEQRSIFNYRVGYLITHEARRQINTLTPGRVATQAGAIPVGDWERFVALHDQKPFDIVMLHASMYDEVDLDWFYEAYRSNIIIIGLNMPHEQMSILTGDLCIENPNPLPMDDARGDFIVAYTLAIETDNESDRPAIIHSKTQTCDDDYAASGYANVLHGSVQTYLTGSTADDVTWLVDFMVAEIMNYNETQRPQPPR